MRAQDLGEEAVLARDHAPVAGIAGGEVGDATHAVAVVVAPREQARAGRRAERGRVEVGEAYAVGGEPVDGRRRDVGAVAAELREADVVEHDQQHVGRAGRRPGSGGHHGVESRQSRPMTPSKCCAMACSLPQGGPFTRRCPRTHA